MQFETTINGRLYNVELTDGLTEAVVDGEPLPFEITRQKKGQILLRSGTKMYKVDTITVDGSQVSFTINGTTVEATVKNEQALLLEKLGFKTTVTNHEGLLKAPMPGKILELLAKEGDEVKTGQPVMILEAMKMENELKAAADGTITTLYVNAGDSVEKNQNLLEITIRG